MSTGPLAVVGTSPHVKALFAKFDRVNDPLISEFTTSVPEKLADAVNHVTSQKVFASDFVMHNRGKIKQFIRKFHTEADTLTAKVEEGIDLLDDPSTQILVSTHQPNLFAYGGVFKKIVMLEALKDAVELRGSRKIINLFIVVDHDFVDESWIRLAQLPSMHHSSGIMELRLPVSESKRWQMVCNLLLPDQHVISDWKRQVKSWIKKNCANADRKKTLLDNLEQFWQLVDVSYSKAKSYSDLNSFLISEVVNKVWGYSTLFVRLSESPAVFENGFAFLMSNFNIYSEALRKTESMFMNHGIDTGMSSGSYLNAPVWIHCKCGSKASARITKNNVDLVLTGPCMSCKKDLELKFGNQNKLDLGSAIHDLSPRAIPIPILLSRDLGISCYATGTGGIGYLVDGSIVSKKLGLELPLVLVWPSKDVYSGIGQAQAIASMKSMQIGNVEQYLQVLEKQNIEYEKKIRPLLAKRAKVIRAGEPVGEILAELFALKEQQRMVRQLISTAEKIRNVTSLSPCFVDYAVNFGMTEIEAKWRNHLFQNGNLASPINL